MFYLFYHYCNQPTFPLSYTWTKTLGFWCCIYYLVHLCFHFFLWLSSYIVTELFLFLCHCWRVKGVKGERESVKNLTCWSYWKHFQRKPCYTLIFLVSFSFVSIIMVTNTVHLRQIHYQGVWFWKLLIKKLFASILLH